MQKNDRIAELENLILRYQASYYANEGEISDADFDLLWDELKSLDPENPILKKIGAEGDADSGNFAKTRHIMPMGSQEKAANPDEFAAWAAKQRAEKFLVEYKLDGASLEMQYENGVFARAVTRGDGEIGDDITRNVLKMRGLVRKLSGNLTGAVRGEVLMPHEAFKNHFSDKANCRNAANGLMKRKDGEQCEFLQIVCYDAYFPENQPFSDEIQKYEWLKAAGFETAPMTFCANAAEVDAYRANVAEKRAEIPYDIDGLVVKNVALDQDDLSRARPEKQIAYKFSLEQAITTLRRVIWSENGATYTPIGEFDAVELAGTTVRRASLANPDLMRKLGAKIGCKVVVTKRGEIIPKIERVVDAPENAEEIEVPTRCAVCGSTLCDDGTRLFCPNKSCEKRILHRLEKWISTLNILEFGENLLRRLFESGKVKCVADLYRLSISDLADIERMGEKSAQNVLDSLAATRKTRLSQFVAGFDIEGIGEIQAEKLVAAGFDSLEKLFSATVADFASVYGFAETTAKILADGLAECKDEMNLLVESGFVEMEKTAGLLAGKSFCFTGELSVKRDIAQAMVKKAGGAVKSSVTKDLSFLVTNDPNSNSGKNKKAAEYGVKVIGEEEFMRLLGK